MKQILSLVSGCLMVTGLAGCAMDMEARKDSRLLGIYVDHIKKNAQDFSEQRTLVAKARTANLNALELKALQAEQAIQRDVAVRQVTKDKDWIDLFEALKSAPDLIAKQRQQYADNEVANKKLLTAAKGAVEINLAKLTEVSASLAALAEDQSAKENASFLVEFMKQVNSSLAAQSKNVEAAATEAIAVAREKSEAK